MTHRSVELNPLDLILLKRVGILDVTTEIPDVRGGILWRGNRLAERMHDLQDFFQVLLPFLKPVLQQPENIFLIKTLKGARGVFGNSMLQFLEEIPVVDDIPVLLILSVKPVDATDRL